MQPQYLIADKHLFIGGGGARFVGQKGHLAEPFAGFQGGQYIFLAVFGNKLGHDFARNNHTKGFGRIAPVDDNCILCKNLLFFNGNSFAN